MGASLHALLNVKTGHHMICISVFSILLVFSRLCFFAFLEAFWYVCCCYRTDIHIRILYHFSFSKVLVSVPPSATFLTVAEMSKYATNLELNFPENFDIKLCTNRHNQREFINVAPFQLWSTAASGCFFLGLWMYIL